MFPVPFNNTTFLHSQPVNDLVQIDASLVWEVVVNSEFIAYLCH